MPIASFQMTSGAQQLPSRVSSVSEEYSAGIFRNIFMRGALERLTEDLPYAKDALGDAFSLRIDFFGHEIGAYIMLAVFAATIVIFSAALIFVGVVKGRKKIK